MNDRVSLRLAFGALVLVVLAVYWNHFDNDFQFDDHHTIVNNAYITDIGNVPRFFTDAETSSTLPVNRVYRPVVNTLNAVDYWLAGGLDPRVFHWHIFIEFILILGLLYLMASGLFELASGERHRFVALLVAAFFGLHTATAETINYIIARSDEFSTLMVLAAMVIFIRNRGWRRHWAIVPFIIGTLAKPTALMLAPIIAVYSALMLRPSLLVRAEQPALAIALKRAVLESAPYFVIGALLFGLGHFMTPDTFTPGGNYSGGEYLVTQAWVTWIYLRTFVLPIGLSADTDMQIIREVLDPRILWGIAVITALLVAAWFTARKRSTLPIAFGILWFFVALVPSSSIIPLAEVMNHHRTFFPYIGLVIAVVWGGYLLFEHLSARVPRTGLKWCAGLAIGAVLTAHAWGTVQRNQVWDSEESLWYDVTVNSPHNGRGLMNYGLALMQKGDMRGALDYFERALKTSYGNHPYLLVNLAIATDALARQENTEHQPQRVEAYFREALEKGTNFPEPYFHYATWLHRQGRDEEALGQLNKAIAMAPGSTRARALQNTLASSTNISLQASRELAEQADTAEAWLNLSLRLYNLGHYGDSIDASRRALAVRPNYALAYNNICAAHNMLEEYDQAIESCERALEIDPSFERARNNLTVARQKLLDR